MLGTDVVVGAGGRRGAAGAGLEAAAARGGGRVPIDDDEGADADIDLLALASEYNVAVDLTELHLDDRRDRRLRRAGGGSAGATLAAAAAVLEGPADVRARLRLVCERQPEQRAAERDAESHLVRVAPHVLKDGAQQLKLRRP